MNKDIEKIRNTICKATGLRPYELENKTRKREIVQARQLCHYYSWFYTKCSLGLIGKEFGGKDHATVLHSIKTIKNFIESHDKETERYLNQIDKILSKYFSKPEKDRNLISAFQKQLTEQIVISKLLLMDINIKWLRIAEN